MNKSCNAQQESESDNEESDATEESSSLSEKTAGAAAKRQKDGSHKKHNSQKTQFSVQRSDVDGLRMKISAIRPPVTSNDNRKNLDIKLKNKEESLATVNATRAAKHNTNHQLGDKLSKHTILNNNNNNNTTSELGLKLKISPKDKKRQEQQEARATGSMPTEAAAATSSTSSSVAYNSNAMLANLPMMPMAKAHCLSDATESGCSEATTKKVKVKRKKAQSKSHHHDIKKTFKKSRPAFSSDSEDDQPLKTQPQRAPRLLLTAINNKAAQLKPLNSLNSVTSALGSDNIGLSSSDNELPDVINAAIKRVESDTDDTADTGFRKAKSKNLPQYQSTLLQDFMEKTQMLGQSTTSAHEHTSPERPAKAARAEVCTESAVASSSVGTVVKKRRGRPRRIDITGETEVTTTTSVVPINESADSGVISTSTNQSTSPSPKMTASVTLASLVTISPPPPATPENARKTELDMSHKHESVVSSTSNSTKPKLDIAAYLDKRMYATERVLYPPPRNKRRQSLSGSRHEARSLDRKSAIATVCSSSTASTSALAAKVTKEELQLDPVWRKIDVNKKFRRPSVSGYKSDGGGGNTTICSKILAAKSGYVSDYGSVHARSYHHHNSGYKSDVSCKSRYSTKSCASRRSRAKSCGYRSDGKESVLTQKSATKFRRKRRCSLMKTQSKSLANLNEQDQDILQLAGLSLGQSSEESNEYVSKPNLATLPTTSVSKKYGEINRFIATGEYFGRGSSGALSSTLVGGNKRVYDTADENGSQDGFSATTSTFNGGGKLHLARKRSSLPTSELTSDMLPLPHPTAHKIKSRRSSIASYCSSYYSGTSKIRRRRRHKSARFPASSKNVQADSKIATEIEIMTNSFTTQCRIQSADEPTTTTQAAAAPPPSKEKLPMEPAHKLYSSAVSTTLGSGAAAVGKTRDKRTHLKKRKMSETLDFAMLSSGSGSLTPSSGSTKRRHKKANSSSPDDHKLPLKKRHYLLTPGEKTTDGTVAVAAKMWANNPEAWAAAAAVAKTTASIKSQQQFSAKTAKAGLTPKKRHLLQTTTQLGDMALSSGSGAIKLHSPLRILVDTTAAAAASSSSAASQPKLLDISPISVSSAKPSTTEAVNKKRTRLEGLVSKIASQTDDQSSKDSAVNIKAFNKSSIDAPQLDSETSCPPPGVFEPTVELEIQIPPITKLSEAAASIITKSEVDSPLLIDLNKPYSTVAAKTEGTRVVETLLNKTGGNLLLKRKRKKINRTGFPTVRRKKRKINEHLVLDITPDLAQVAQKEESAPTTPRPVTPPMPTRVAGAKCAANSAPQTDLSNAERNIRTPRLSVVALERLQSTPTPASPPTPPPSKQPVQKSSKQNRKRAKDSETPPTDKRPKLATAEEQPASASANPPPIVKAKRGRKPKRPPAPMQLEGSVPTELEQPKATLSRDTRKSIQQLEDASCVQAKSAATEREPPKASLCRDTRKSIHSRVAAQLATSQSPTKASNTRAALQHEPPKAAATSRAVVVAAPTSRAVVAAAPYEPYKPQPHIFSKANEPELKKSPPALRKVKKLLPEGTSTSTLSKSSIHKIITAKSLEAKVKLPAGIDPNTNFSCKIRLKRRNLAKVIKASSQRTGESEPTHEEIERESALKDVNAVALEHDVLPPAESQLETYASSDHSEEKPANSRTGRPKKNYLAAGVFSNFFKVDAKERPKPTPAKRGEKRQQTRVTTQQFKAEATGVHPLSRLLPPQPYCEGYLRRRQVEFELPYDIWHARKTKKLTRPTPQLESWKFRKIRTNIYSEAVRPNMSGFEHPMCNCKPDPGCGENCLNRLVYTECSPSNCPAGENCRNQKIQRYEIALGTERYMTERKGYGIRANKPIPRGTYIMEYVGEVVTEREFKARMGTIYLNDVHHYCLHLDGGLVIDGHRMGSNGRFVNHSCMPNCEMQKWSVNGLSRMALFAKHDINADEELTYDYNFALFNPLEGQCCFCNTPLCRGVIGGKSQRVKPTKPIEPACPKDTAKARQRKQKARKNTTTRPQRDVALARVQQLLDREKKLVQQTRIFLVRNFEKIRRRRAKLQGTKPNDCIPSSSSTSTAEVRRPTSPAMLAAQISALCTSRNIKTRGLTLAVQDPEVEKMAKIAVVLREICSSLETLKDPNDSSVNLTTLALTAAAGSHAGHKKKRVLKSALKKEAIDLKTIQLNIEQGHYKDPKEFDKDMQKIFVEARQQHGGDETKLKALELLIKAYEDKKQFSYPQLLGLLNDETALQRFAPKASKPRNKTPNAGPSRVKQETPANSSCIAEYMPTGSEDIIRCICGLYKDEGLMIQCARCMVWQHAECTKADVNADYYHCEKCEPRVVDREIQLDDFTEDGYRYYLSLMRGDLHVRQGDAVYVLRDIPMRDATGNVIPHKKHDYQTIGDCDYNECDIFRIERLWKNHEGKRFIFGHHFLRPHETFHEPSRRFYPNEVVRVPLYEVVPIELVIGRCWVLDRTTFCKGRPIECVDETHCYICELRVDKSARFFSKAKVNYPICTKPYAFRKFPEKLKISKTYAPHVVDPAILKSKKIKTESDALSAATTTATAAAPETPKAPRGRRPAAASPAATVRLISPAPPNVQTIKDKCLRLEKVLQKIKVKSKNTQTCSTKRSPMDASYLLAGRGARKRKQVKSTTAPA